jgi:hypothetical protein
MCPMFFFYVYFTNVYIVVRSIKMENIMVAIRIFLKMLVKIEYFMPELNVLLAGV